MNCIVPKQVFDSRNFVDDRTAPGIRTLIADHDPVSRRVVDGVLRGSEQVDVIATIDSHQPFVEWPLCHVDVAVLGIAPGDPSIGMVRQLVARMIRVLLIGLDWTRRSLDAAAAAGAAGYLVKDSELTGVVGAVHAVAGGNMVLSPELLALYSPRDRNGSAQHGGPADPVRMLSDREREVLTLLGEGMSTAEVARACGVSNATIKSHVSHSLTKLGARNRLEAVLMVKDVKPHG